MCNNSPCDGVSHSPPAATTFLGIFWGMTRTERGQTAKTMPVLNYEWFCGAYIYIFEGYYKTGKSFMLNIMSNS